MNNFLFSYHGNKYIESKKYLNEIGSRSIYNDFSQESLNANPSIVIIEPFCGIFGFSRAFYEIEIYKKEKAEIRPNFGDVKFIFNDIDSEMIGEYILMKNDIDKYIDDFKNDFNSLKTIAKENDCIIEVKFKNSRSEAEQIIKLTQLEKKLYSKGAANPLSRILRFILCGESICKNQISIQKVENKISRFEKKKKIFNDFFQRCEFFNKNFDDFMRGQLLKRETLIYYDPPYFDSSNKHYNSFVSGIDKSVKYSDNTTLYVDMLKWIYSLNNCYHIMVLNKLCLFDYLIELKQSINGKNESRMQTYETKGRYALMNKNLKYHKSYIFPHHNHSCAALHHCDPTTSTILMV